MYAVTRLDILFAVRIKRKTTIHQRNCAISSLDPRFKCVLLCVCMCFISLFFSSLFFKNECSIIMKTAVQDPVPILAVFIFNNSLRRLVYQ